jgi:Gpi18-like mannosyltransferase
LDIGVPGRFKNLVYHVESKKGPIGKNDFTHRAKFPFTTVILLIAGTRAAIFVLSFLMELIANKLQPGLFPKFWSSWFIQDSPHYICVAENGYISNGYDSIFIVFYPLYPYLIKFANTIVNNFYFSGILISNTFFIIACYFLYKLVMLEFNNENLSKKAVGFLIIFPFSFFMNIIYTESLFLALSTMVFYFARKKKFLFSGICGMLAALTKNQGMLLFIPILVEILLNENFQFLIENKRKNESFLYLAKTTPYAFLPLTGFGLYLLINKLVTGDLFKFLEYQKEYWGNTMWLFSNSIKQSFLSFFDHDLIYIIGTYFPQLVFFFLTVLLIMFFIGKVRITYTLYPLVYLIFSYSPSALLSGPRYISGMVPLYIFLAFLADNDYKLKTPLFYTCITLLFFFSLTFVGGGTY